MLEFLRLMLDGRFDTREERGASAVEYGLLIAGIAALIVLIVFTLGGTIKGAFSDTNTCISTNGTNSAACN